MYEVRMLKNNVLSQCVPFINKRCTLIYWKSLKKQLQDNELFDTIMFVSNEKIIAVASKECGNVPIKKFIKQLKG